MDEQPGSLIERMRSLPRDILPEHSPSIQYGKGEHQKYYLFKTTTPNAPLLIFIHGGGWVTDQSQNFYKMGNVLSSLGINMILVKYNVSTADNNIKYPKHLFDCLFGVLHVLNNKDLEYNKDKVFLGGHSAGGFMSLIICFDIKSFWPGIPVDQLKLLNNIKGLVLAAGVYDLMGLIDYNQEYKQAFIYDAFGNDEKYWKLVSPVELKCKGNKMDILFIHSTKDTLLHLNQGLSMIDKLKEHNVQLELLNLGDHNDMPPHDKFIEIIARYTLNFKNKL